MHMGTCRFSARTDITDNLSSLQSLPHFNSIASIVSICRGETTPMFNEYHVSTGLGEPPPEILHLSVYRIRQLIRENRLKAYVHVGRCNTKRLFVLEEDLRRFISEEFLEDYWPGLKRPKK
jgi:hypothetical protein